MTGPWELRKLGDVCTFVRGPFGGSLKKSMFVDDGYAVYEQQHAINNQFEDVRYFIGETKFFEMKRFELRPNDLIMSCSGTMGKVAIVPDHIRRGIINQALLKLTPSSSIDVHFLELWMQSAHFQEQLAAETTGAAIKNVASVSILKEFRIPVPTLMGQKRIVAILDEAFEGIAKATANAERNLANARELFLCKLEAVFAAGRQTWVETTVGATGRVQTGNTPPASLKEAYGSHIPFIKPGDFSPNGDLDYYNDGLSAEGLEASRVFDPGSALMVCIGATIGKTGYADRPVSANQQINAVSPRAGVNGRFVFHQMRSSTFQAAVVKSSSQATLPIINKTKWSALPVWIPTSETLQAEIAKQLDALEVEAASLAQAYSRKITLMSELRISLLHQAFSGQLTGREVIAA